MKTAVMALVLGLSILFASPVLAGNTIKNACLKSDRNAATRTMCACLQTVADAVLSNAEQRRGAKFFGDPHASEDLRMATGRSEILFWQKWQVFGQTAKNHCQ